MFITLFEMEENRSLGGNIIEKFTDKSVIPVVEGVDKYGLCVARVAGVFECEEKLVVELNSEVNMADGTFESIAYSVNKEGGLRHIGIVRSGGDFAFEGDESPADYTSFIIEAAGGVSVNRKGVSHANSLVSAGKVNRTASWSFSGADGNAILGNNNWKKYARWFLGVRPGTNPQSKAHYAYPYGKGGQVYRRGVIAAKSRSAQQGHTAVNSSATRLLARIDKGQKK
jgi:hypothetical protein